MPARESDIQCDPTADVEWRRPDNRFVPIRACELIAALVDDAKRFGCDRDGLVGVATALRDVIEQETGAFERELADSYAVFSPDRDTQPIKPLEELRTPDAYDCLFSRLSYLLEKANFEKLTNVQIDQFVSAANSHGLRVRLRPELIEHLEIWVRGRGEIERETRTFRHPFRGVTRKFAIFRRIVVVARRSDAPHVIIKMFKDIPEVDVEALLPHAEVEMNWRDRILLMGGGAGTIGSTAMKISKLAISLVTLSKLLWVVLVGAAILAWRTLMGYRRACSSRDSQRTRHLYYQNLNNNAGAIQALTAMIGQEELKEAVLAYALCHGDGAGIRTADDLADAADRYLSERFGVEVDFDATDAIESLRRLELCTGKDCLCPVSCGVAVNVLAERWRRRISEKYHGEMVLRYAGRET